MPISLDHAYYKQIMSYLMWVAVSACRVKNGKCLRHQTGRTTGCDVLRLGFPVAFDDMTWKLLYPGVFDCSIGSRVKEFYSLFFHYDLTDAELDKLMVYAVPNSSPTPAATQASVPAAGICADVAVALVGIDCRCS